MAANGVTGPLNAWSEGIKATLIPVGAFAGSVGPPNTELPFSSTGFGFTLAAPFSAQSIPLPDVSSVEEPSSVFVSALIFVSEVPPSSAVCPGSLEEHPANEKHINPASNNAIPFFILCSPFLLMFCSFSLFIQNVKVYILF